MFIIVAGVGTIGAQVIKKLIGHKHDVVGIDVDINICNAIHNETGVIAINGNATDIKVLQEAGSEKADVLLCLMRNDANNIACALLGKSFNIPQIVAALRKPVYENAYECAGVNSIIKVPDLLLNQIITEVEQPAIRRIKNIEKGAAGVYTITIPAKAKLINKTIKEITDSKKFSKECIFIGILRENNEDFLIPHGNNTIQAGDTIFLVSKTKFIKKAASYLIKK